MDGVYFLLRIAFILVIVSLGLLLIKPVAGIKKFNMGERLLIIGPLIIINAGLLPLLFVREQMSSWEHFLQMSTMLLVLITIVFNGLLKLKLVSMCLFLLSVISCFFLLISTFIL